MIEFVTLLLGLVAGSQAVELNVSDEVALVEVRLDGRFVGGLSRPPWIVNCDFGSELAPHELVAIAYDAHRQELQTIRQWVNLPRDRLEARLALDHSSDGAASARLIWSSLDAQGPPQVRVTFDGQSLVANDLEAIALPPHDLRGVHFLRAELELATGGDTPSVAYAELVFGGSFGDRVSTELTARLLTAAGQKKKRQRKQNPALSPEAMGGWLRKGNQELAVVAVDRGPVNLLVVRERSTATFEGLREVFEELYRQYRPPPRAALGLTKDKEPPTAPTVLSTGDRVRFAYPTTGREQVRVGQGTATLLSEQVPVSHNVTDLGPLFDILTSAYSAEDEAPVEQQQLADAVAIAGVVAATGDQRRAVLLIRSGTAQDSSRFSPQVVRGYLQKLGVPLVVWSIGADEDSTAWGQAHEISGYRQMERALNDLRQMLESQLIVWVEGAHLSHEIELTDLAVGLKTLS